MKNYALTQQLLSAIPYGVRYGVENTLSSFHDSLVMLGLYERALTRSRELEQLQCPTTIAAFGSFGRLDGAAHLSDFDILYIYAGKEDAQRYIGFQDVIREVVTHNSAFQFDHREAIETQTFDYSSSPAYPILSEEELLGNDPENRAIQLLTEGRFVYREEYGNSLRDSILVKNYGYDNNKHSFSLDLLRKELKAIRVGYCTSVMESLKKGNDGRKNQKIAKLFALREFFYVSTLFAISEIALRVATQGCTEREAVNILSAPTVLKIASFARGTGVLAAISGQISPEYSNKAADTLRSFSEDIPGQLRNSCSAVASGNALPDNVRPLCISVIENYDALLQRLHDEDFLRTIAPLSTDYLTWRVKPVFSSIVDGRKKLFDASCALASSLLGLIEDLGNALQAAEPALEDAKKSLSLIVDYELQL